jgi:CheY-like chemotaxis protein
MSDSLALIDREDTILVIDDDETDLSFTVRSIKSQMPQARIETNDTGLAALSRLTTMAEPGAPLASLVLIDQRMPGMNGQDILEKLQASGLPEKVPIVLFSSAVAPAQVEAILTAGARAYVVKPVSPEQYQEAIKGLLKRFLQD